MACVCIDYIKMYIWGKFLKMCSNGCLKEMNGFESSQVISALSEYNCNYLLDYYREKKKSWFQTSISKFEKYSCTLLLFDRSTVVIQFS